MTHRTLAAAIGLLLASSVAAADYKEDFKNGMEAADLERWDKAAAHFRDAIAKNPKESEERIFLSGVFSAPYLPHFQLGRSLYSASRDNCPEVLVEWKVSESHGAIRGLGKLFEELTSGREECHRLLLPSAVAAATREIKEAAAALQRFPTALTDEAREGQRQTAIDQLQQAREDLKRGQDEPDLAAVQSASAGARAASAELERLAELEKQTDIEKVPAATMTAAENAIASAEAEWTAFAYLLAEPGARDNLLADETLREALLLEGTITSYATRLESGLDSRQVESLTLEVADAAARLGRARRRALDLLAAVEAAPATTTVAPRDPAQPVATPSTPAEDGSLAIGLGRLIADAEALLDSTEARDSGSELLAGQHERLTAILTQARRAEAAAMAGLSERILASMTAIRLVSAAHSLFTGQPERAIQLLDEQEFGPEPLAAHAHLLRAAARFSLFRRQADGDSSLVAVAAEDVRRSSELDPSLRPDPAMFSPAFIAFFQAQGTEAGAKSES